MKKLLIISIAILVFLGWAYLIFTYLLIAPKKIELEEIKTPTFQQKVQENEQIKEDSSPESREGKG